MINEKAKKYADENSPDEASWLHVYESYQDGWEDAGYAQQPHPVLILIIGGFFIIIILAAIQNIFHVPIFTEQFMR
jgi:hypothetical protein